MRASQPTLNGVVARATLRQPRRHRGEGTARHQVIAKDPLQPIPPGSHNWALDGFFERLIRFFSSLRLTVVCLALGLVLVFAGTLAQVEIGLLKAQNEFFRSFFVFWMPKGAAFKIPVLPGGYLLGGLLLINLTTAHLTRFQWTKKKAGIWLIQFGLILLLLGQLLTDILARESALQLAEGQTKNFSEEFRSTELVLIDKSDPSTDLLHSVSDSLVRQDHEIRDPRLPLGLRVNKLWPNAAVVQPDAQAPMAISTGATAGELKDARLIPEPGTTEGDQRNFPAALVEVMNGEQSLGKFFLTSRADSGEKFLVGNKPYEIAFRFVRHYYPFSLTLLKATHEEYRGTKIPKNFASRVRVQNAEHNETRETTIYMNNPLRYSGLTFYQYQMSAGEVVEQAGMTPVSTFQVVRNPSWLTPYVSCLLVGLGLLVQFGFHLMGFLKRRTI